jgi:2-polyprenyl-3-methyl-5-hydroxy-6-metoxy-1,4-benzoquinol methylase
MVQKKIDTGSYNRDQAAYDALVKELYETHDPITLDATYANFFVNDQTGLLIQLARYKFVTRMIKKTDRVLEIGCGHGLGCMFIGQFSKNVTGIDVKRSFIEEAIKLNRRDNVEYAVEDFFEFSTKKKFDVIVAIDVIEHLEINDGQRMIKKIAECLKSDGMIIIGCPSIYSFPHQGPLSQASHIHCYDKDELCSSVEKYFSRAVGFSMNDEMVHTGHAKMSWYNFALGFGPEADKN